MPAQTDPFNYELWGFVQIYIRDGFIGNLNLRQEQIQKKEKGILKVYTIPVGQGDSSMIVCPGKNSDVTFIDMGSENHALTKERFGSSVMDFTENGKRIKHIFFTHPDSDHINYFLGATGLFQKLIKSPDLREEIGESRVKIKIHIGTLANWGSLPNNANENQRAEDAPETNAADENQDE